MNTTFEPPTFRDDGVVVFKLLAPIICPTMDLDGRVRDSLIAEVEGVMASLDIKTYCKPAFSYRQGSDGLELWCLSSIIPGTVSLRTVNKKPWHPRRKKKSP